MNATSAVGEYGERLAERHLAQAGMRILARRWRCSRGEIDLIAVDEGALVVCEVKTRRSQRAGSALDAVTPLKLARMHSLAAIWLAQQEEWFPQVRFDVVAVMLPRRGAAVVEHVRGVIA